MILPLHKQHLTHLEKNTQKIAFLRFARSYSRYIPAKKLNWWFGCCAVVHSLQLLKKFEKEQQKEALQERFGINDKMIYSKTSIESVSGEISIVAANITYGDGIIRVILAC